MCLISYKRVRLYSITWYFPHILYCHEFQLPLAPEVFKKGGQYLLRLGSEDVPGLSDAKNNLRMSGMKRTKW